MNATLSNKSLSLAALAVTATLFAPATTVSADPLPGRDQLKFVQQPMDGTILINPNGVTNQYWGHDELSTAYSTQDATGPTPYRGTYMADDFADKFNSPVVHVKWWGSYLNNFTSTAIPVDKFLISFESDVPVGPNNPFSHPGTPLLNQIVKRGPIAPGSGTFAEKLISAGGAPLNENLYEYNAELHLGREFFEKADTVYWLKIVALVDVPAGITIDPAQPPTFLPRWGWHNRDYTIMDPLASTAPAVAPGEHVAGNLPTAPAVTPVWHFQDDAVTGNIVINPFVVPGGDLSPLVDQAGYAPTRYLAGIDGPAPIADFSKDLAFALYTLVPEPTSAGALIGAVALLSKRLPRRRPRD